MYAENERNVVNMGSCWELNPGGGGGGGGRGGGRGGGGRGGEGGGGGARVSDTQHSFSPDRQMFRLEVVKR